MGHNPHKKKPMARLLTPLEQTLMEEVRFYSLILTTLSLKLINAGCSFISWPIVHLIYTILKVFKQALLSYDKFGAVCSV